MCGTSEWCRDWYDENYYLRSPEVDPQGPSLGEKRVMRGETSVTTLPNPIRIRFAFREGTMQEFRQSFTGFRVVMEVE